MEQFGSPVKYIPIVLSVQLFPMAVSFCPFVKENSVQFIPGTKIIDDLRVIGRIDFNTSIAIAFYVISLYCIIDYRTICREPLNKCHLHSYHYID